jgi:hypothetical protein
LGQEQENPRRKSKTIYIWEWIDAKNVRAEMDKLYATENELAKLEEKAKGLGESNFKKTDMIRFLNDLTKIEFWFLLK